MLHMDFTSQDYLRDPATGLAKLRAAGPVVEVRFPIIGRTWVTTTSDLASHVLKDSETFTMRKNGKVAGLRWWMPGWIRTLAVSMLTMNEPDHTRLRSIVDEAFRRRAILEMEPRIFAIANELAAELFADGSPADLAEIKSGLTVLGASAGVSDWFTYLPACDCYLFSLASGNFERRLA